MNEDRRVTPNPRTVLAFLAAILAVQAAYAAIGVLSGGTSATAGSIQPFLTVAVIVYVAMAAAFAFAVWQHMPWAWPLAVALTVAGLAIAVVRVSSGEPIDGHILGMAIDAGLLFYLQKPSIKGLFDT